MAAARRKARGGVQPGRRARSVLDCGLRGMLLLALLLFLAGMSVYSWSASSIFPDLPLSTRMNTRRRNTGDGSDGDEFSTTTAAAAAAGGLSHEAVVDLSSRDLYDRIGFENKAGGAWTQGWPVSYKGNEWDGRDQHLLVFVVPHSHNDPGWIRTVEEYYQERTKSILSTVVHALSKDSRRKFIWEEMSYLQRWWQDASEGEKNEFKRLVRGGQLEIVGGGWVMNDEANSHFYAIIEQITAGNLWLRDTIGVTPENSWAIDPFGHSSTMPYLLSRMGFRNMLIQRTHYEVKKVLAQEQSLEFMWRQSWDTTNTTDILCHMMPFYSYDIPHTCGPEPAVCCQFDYWRLVRVGGAQRCPWGLNPQEINQENVRERSLLLLDQYRKKSTLYKSNVLLVPLGDDFRYVTSQEAELQFTNYQAIFDYVNSHSSELKAKVQFGTLNDYFTALRSRLSTKSFPSFSGDFFTYADRMHDYWSGYYVSRPFYKAVDRVLEDALRAANQLFVFTYAKCKPSQGTSFPLSHAESLVSASRNLALFQHHDGVTGTAKDHVMEDYGMRMHDSLLELQSFMAASVEILSTGGYCQKTSNWLYQAEETRTKFNLLPVKASVKLNSGQARRVVLHNSLEEDVQQVVTVVVDDPAVCVLNSDTASVNSQVSPEWFPGTSSNRHRLQWTALVPAMGLATFFVTSSTGFCTRASTSRLKVFNVSVWDCPRGYSCTYQNIEEVQEEIRISNEHHSLGFDSSTGMLRWLSTKSSSSGKVGVEEDVAYYSSQGSGAYLFLPNGEAQSLVQAGGLVLVVEGPLMQEVHAVVKSSIGGQPVSRSARLFSGEAPQSKVVEMIYNVELLENRFNNKELIARFKTGVKSGKRVFHSDSNGFQTIRRESYDKIPLQGNYYPMPSLAFVQDPAGIRFSVHSRQALGVASLQDGWLEMMLDRRLTQDDGRGLGQGVMDNRPLSVAFHLLLEKNISAASTASTKFPSLLSYRVSAQLNYPLHAFLNTAQEEEATKAENWSPLTSPLPCDLHVVGLKALRPQTPAQEQQQFGLVLQRRGWDESYCRKGGGSCSRLGNSGLNLHTVFKDLPVSEVVPTSLNFLHESSRLRSRKSADEVEMVTLKAMELQAYRFSVAT